MDNLNYGYNHSTLTFPSSHSKTKKKRIQLNMLNIMHQHLHTCELEQAVEREQAFVLFIWQIPYMKFKAYLKHTTK